MFKAINRSLIFTLLTLTASLVLTACGSGGGGSSSGSGPVVPSVGGPNSSSSGSGAVRGLEKSAWLPSDTQARWYYNYQNQATSIRETKVLSGNSVEVYQHASGATENIFTDTNTVGIQGVYLPSVVIAGVGVFTVDLTFNNYLAVLNEGASIGATASLNTGGTVDISPTYGRRNINVTGSSRYLGEQQVTVPYGTFNARGASFEIEARANIDGTEVILQYNGEFWFVEGLGIVRRRVTSTGGELVELTNYSGPFDPNNPNGNNGNPQNPQNPQDPGTLDSDNDGVPDTEDKFPNDSSESKDSDLDGIGDNADADDDNDSVLDAVDAFPLDPTESVDSDADGIGNNADVDDDNDSVPDINDAFPLLASESSDADNDGIGDNADQDDDNDSTPDSVDAFPFDPSEAVDTDRDGIGNNADDDDDNDVVPDISDAFPLDASETSDADKDGIGDNADPDDDNDGVVDDIDAFPLDPTAHVALTVSDSPDELQRVYGSDRQMSDVVYQVTNQGADWEVSSSEDWAVPELAAAKGGGNLIVKVDTTNLMPGSYATNIIFDVLADSTQRVRTITVNVVNPEFSLDTQAIELDVSAGHGSEIYQTVNAKINTGENNYSFSFMPDFPFEDAIKIESSGTVNENGSDIKFSVNPVSLPEGEHRGEIIVHAERVNGGSHRQTIAISVLASDHSVYVPENGLAFSQFPNHSHLERVIDVFDSNGFEITSIDVSYDVPWIEAVELVEPGKIRVAVDPSVVENDKLHEAQIVLNSTNTRDNIGENINVSLWVGGENIGLRHEISGSFNEIVFDPVRPYVYANNGSGGDIDIYNSYTGALVKRVEDISSFLGKMEVSHNGDYLFIANGNEMLIVDLSDNSDIQGWSSDDFSGGRFNFSRTTNDDLIYTSDSKAFSAFTGEPIEVESTNPQSRRVLEQDINVNGNRLCQTTQSLIFCYALRYNSLKSQLLVEKIPGQSSFPSNGRDIALNRDGTIAYAASGAPYAFGVIDIEANYGLTQLDANPYPNNIEVSPTGQIVGAIDTFNNPEQAWLYEADYTLTKIFRNISGNGKINHRSLRISGDGSMGGFVNDKNSLILFSLNGPEAE